MEAQTSLHEHVVRGAAGSEESAAAFPSDTPWHAQRRPTWRRTAATSTSTRYGGLQTDSHTCPHVFAAHMLPKASSNKELPFSLHGSASRPILQPPSAPTPGTWQFFIALVQLAARMPSPSTGCLQTGGMTLGVGATCVCNSTSAMPSPGACC